MKPELNTIVIGMVSVDFYLEIENISKKYALSV
jgi:hypothetical protein